jgi:DNA-binding MarR family transcriptional regulator
MKRDDGLNADSQDILDSIRRIVRALRVSSKSVELTLGISSAQLFVLQKLRDEGGVSLNELADRTLTHQSSVSVVVSKLVEQGLVQRKKAKDDERRVEISITSQGRALLKKAPAPFQDLLIHSIDQLPFNQRTQVAKGLKAIVEMTEIQAGPAPLFFEDHPKKEKHHD